MPTSIASLLNSVQLHAGFLKTVKWGQHADSSSTGIYFVSTSSNPDLNTNLFDKAPINDNQLRFWLNKVNTIQIDGRSNPTVTELKKRLSAFWLPDENIVYIGQTESSQGLKGRINQYYKTELGERKPHAGGHWIKVLENLNELFVHYIPAQNAEKLEKEIIKQFAAQVSKQTRELVFDRNLSIPFANLEIEKGNRKRHGISESKS